MNIMKIMAICGSGLGSSFMVEMNIKKVLKKMEANKAKAPKKTKSNFQKRLEQMAKEQQKNLRK